MPKKIIRIPKTSLVVLCGTAASGKSTFARKHFPPDAIVSSDECRYLISGDESNQAVSGDAFNLLHQIIDRRLKWARLTVADTTALMPDARKNLLKIARRHDFQAVAVLFDVPEEICRRWNRSRSRSVAEDVLTRQMESFEKALEDIGNEDFYKVIRLTPDDIDACEIDFTSLRVELNWSGPFDLFGPLEGCADLLHHAFGQVGYQDKNGWNHPGGRKAVFVGNVVGTRGGNLSVIRTISDMVDQRRAVYLAGPADRSLFRACQNSGSPKADDRIREITGGIPKEHQEDFEQRFMALYRKALPYVILDSGRLVAAYAGIERRMIGRLSARIIDHCVNGPSGQRKVHSRSGKGPLIVSSLDQEQAFRERDCVGVNSSPSESGSLKVFQYPEMKERSFSPSR